MTGVSLNAGTNVIVFKKKNTANYYCVDGITVQAGDGSLNAVMGSTTLEDDTIEFGAATAAGKSDYLFESGSWGVATSTSTTYSSSNTSVATVNNSGVVRGVAPGTAEITAIVDGTPLAPKTITVTPATVSGNVKFFAEGLTSSDVWYNSALAEDFVEGDVNDVAAGTYVRLVAPERAGYVFKYWMIGGGDNGSAISTEASYTFRIWSPTYIAPVYDYVGGGTLVECAVELWNANGQLYDKVMVPVGTLFGDAVANVTAPTLTGYTQFDGWSLADNVAINSITRAIAKFSIPATVNLTVNGAARSVAYGGVVEVPDATAHGVWKLDGQPVKYADTDLGANGWKYSRFAWGGEEITFESGRPKALAPIAAIADDAKNGAVMVEYDKGVMFTYEVGVIFGDSADITLNSYISKASTQEIVQHGQITAKRSGSEQYARGYIIYADVTDGNAVKIYYTKAVSLS